MVRANQLRKIISIAIIAISLVVSTAFGNVSALAVDVGGEQTSYGAAPYPKGESGDINGSYHRLQAATQNYRKEVLDDYSDRFQQGDKTANKNRNPLKPADEGRNPLERAVDSVRGKLNAD